LSFFNEVRATVEKCEPNLAHLDIAQLENTHTVHVITTNIDELHEMAGSTNVIHVHGSIFESCDINYHHIEKCNVDINIGDMHPKSHSQLRHNVVMFGEMPFHLNYAQRIISEANVLVVVGTSLSVYPAAGLVERFKGEIFYIDPEAIKITENTIPIKAKSTYGIKAFKQYIESRNII
jgi:NAD-dependent deacetylase